MRSTVRLCLSPAPLGRFRTASASPGPLGSPDQNRSSTCSSRASRNSKEAAVGYQKTLIQAWHEVVNALVIYRLEQQCLTQLKLPIELPASALGASATATVSVISHGDRCRADAFTGYATVTSITNVSLKPRKLFKALDGSRLPEFARCPRSDARRDDPARRHLAEMTIELRAFSDP